MLFNVDVKVCVHTIPKSNSWSSIIIFIHNVGHDILNVHECDNECQMSFRNDST